MTITKLVVQAENKKGDIAQSSQIVAKNAGWVIDLRHANHALRFASRRLASHGHFGCGLFDVYRLRMCIVQWRGFAAIRLPLRETVYPLRVSPRLTLRYRFPICTRWDKYPARS